jgi:methylmalonyl-CoA/ethylmalonyl-CoA epimerase
VARFIKKKGEGIHHIAFAVKDIQEQLKHAAANGIRLVNEVPVKGADDLDVAFLHPVSTSGVLIEICEDKKD